MRTRTKLLVGFAFATVLAVSWAKYKDAQLDHKVLAIEAPADIVENIRKMKSASIEINKNNGKTRLIKSIDDPLLRAYVDNTHAMRALVRISNQFKRAEAKEFLSINAMFLSAVGTLLCFIAAALDRIMINRQTYNSKP